MKDEKVLARCNLFGVFGAIPTLLSLDTAAAELVRNKKISLGFLIKDGPSATLSFEDGRAEMREGVEHCSIKLYFSSCKKFNDMIDGKGSPLPISGFWHIGFLLDRFVKLTDILSAYLRPAPEKLEDAEFFRRSTVLMLHVIAGAVAEVGNYDKVGSFSASNMVDGTVRVAIGEELGVGVDVKDHHLTALHDDPHIGFSEMRFADLRVARDLFDGRINAVAAVGEGKVRIGGMISQVDNLNRILDRVSIYLA